MLDRDLAKLYRVETRAVNQAVKRNQDRFPEDFMFQLTSEEAEAVLPSRSQIVILKRGKNIKYLPYAFTEHGVVMLANVLKSGVAIRASIQVVRAFVHLRQFLATNQQLARKIEALRRSGSTTSISREFSLCCGSCWSLRHWRLAARSDS